MCLPKPKDLACVVAKSATSFSVLPARIWFNYNFWSKKKNHLMLYNVINKKITFFEIPVIACLYFYFLIE